MTSRQHQDWINRGKPDSGLALPLQLLANTLAAAGYTVYVYPNDAHLDAQPPEDHTYYSETGWPHTSPKWWRHAIDVMPPPAGSKLPSLTQLGQTIFNARQAGQITWLKYMNWPNSGSLSHAVQDRWEPDHQRGSSSDTGHIHISSVTGCETLDSSFNPLTSVVVVGSTTPTPHHSPGDEMTTFLAQRADGTLLLCDGMRARIVTVGQLGDIVTLINEGRISPIIGIGGNGTAGAPGTVKAGDYFPRSGFTEGAFGALDVAPTFTAAITDAQVSALAADVVAGLAAQAPAAQLTAADVAAELSRRLQA